MAVRDSGFEGSFSIPSPKGVFQAAGDTNVNVEYAYRAENMRTERGLLATAYGTSRSFPSLGVPIETLTRFYRRNKPNDPDVYIAAAGGSIYAYTLGTEGWRKLNGDDMTFLSNRWSYVTYETSEGGETVDILLMSNEKDGMIAVVGSDPMRVERKTLNLGNDFKEVKFAHLSRYAERIWGTGATGYPDSVFYSRAYDPFDWTEEDDALAEKGGGRIDQPTWDGDSFIALEPFGGYLLAIKSNTLFEIRGTDPTNFTITQGYGTDGPVQARTICTDRMQTYFLSQGGIGVYDGSSMRLLSRDALYETMRMRMTGTDEKSTACICDHRYFLALRVKENVGDVITENTQVIEFDIERGTFMIRTGVRIKDFFVLDGAIYIAQADEPYDVLNYDDEQAKGYLGLPIMSVWETGWLDLGKAFRKSDFELRFTADADEDDVPLDITVITDKREKTKTILLHKDRRDYRVKIQQKGVRVRLRIESGRKAAGWRIYGGVQVLYSMDEV